MNTKSNAALDLLQTAFAEGRPAAEKADYRHPHEAAILTELRADLSQSDLGLRLLRMADEQGIRIAVVKRHNTSGFVPGSRCVYVSMPATRQTPSVRQMLDLAGGLREAEQELMGFRRPGPNADPLDFAAINHAKQLDIIVNICKVACELSEKRERPDVLDAIEDAGYRGIYDACIRERSDKAVLQAYFGE